MSADLGLPLLGAGVILTVLITAWMAHLSTCRLSRTRHNRDEGDEAQT